MATERSVNGLRVVREEAVETEKSTAANPIYYRRMKKLHLEDGSETYACLVKNCGRTSPRLGVLRNHLQEAHGPSSRAPKEKAPAPTSVMGMTVEQMLGTAAENIDLRKQLEQTKERTREWKDRALSAERKLNKVMKRIERLTGQ